MHSACISLSVRCSFDSGCQSDPMLLLLRRPRRIDHLFNGAYQHRPYRRTQIQGYACSLSLFCQFATTSKEEENFLSKCGKWSLYACRLLHGLQPETWAGNLVMFIAFLEQLVLCQSWHRQTFQLTIISWTSLQYIWNSFRKNLFYMFNLNVSSRTVSDFLLAEIKLYVFFSDRSNFPSCELF